MIQANVGGSERREERGGGGVCLSEGGGSLREKNEREVYVAMAGRWLTGRRRRRCWTAVEGGGGVVGGGCGRVKTETGWSLDYCALVLAGAGLAGWLAGSRPAVSLSLSPLSHSHYYFHAGVTDRSGQGKGRRASANCATTTVRTPGGSLSPTKLSCSLSEEYSLDLHFYLSPSSLPSGLCLSPSPIFPLLTATHKKYWTWPSPTECNLNGRRAAGQRA